MLGTVGADSGHSDGPLKKTISFLGPLSLGLRVGVLKNQFPTTSNFSGRRRRRRTSGSVSGTKRPSPFRGSDGVIDFRNRDSVKIL